MSSPNLPINHTQPPNSHPAQASTNYKEAFALFDKRGNGRVAIESLGDLLRACGQNPTLAEIADLEKGVGGDCKSFFFLLRPYWKRRRRVKAFLYVLLTSELAWNS